MGDKDVVARNDSASPEPEEKHPVKWYRSTIFNAVILGICNFLAPGLWGAMNSLGAGGEETPFLVNTGNALTFCLMVLTCMFSSVLVHYIGIKWTLVLGTVGYAPYAAGLYTNNRYGTEWFVLVGSALCGLSAGIFWASEAAIALAYPEPYRRGQVLGLWLSFRVGGQLVGGVINLGINAKDNNKGSVSYTVYLIFIALQAAAPIAGFFLSKPSKVQRTDGVKVNLSIADRPLRELKQTARRFFTKEFLLIVPFISQAVYTEAVMFTFESLYLSVRARALGSFLSAAVAAIAGNVLGYWLDRTKIALGTRARGAFFTISILQGGWFIWATVLFTRYRVTQPTYDWVDDGFGRTFALFLFLVMGFQVQYLFLYFLIHSISKSEADTVRLAGLLRATESASQAVSYGLNSIPIFADVGGLYLNFGLWGIALFPAWLVIRHIGAGTETAEVVAEVEKEFQN